MDKGGKKVPRPHKVKCARYLFANQLRYNYLAKRQPNLTITGSFQVMSNFLIEKIL